MRVLPPEGFSGGSHLFSKFDRTDSGMLEIVSPIRPMIKKLLHTRMRVSDMDATLRFYHDLLGLEVMERKRSPRGSDLAFLKVPRSEELIELCAFPASGPVQVPEDLVHLAFEVEDLDRTMALLKEKGIPITDGPTVTSSGSRFCFIDAPDRYEIELIERPASLTDAELEVTAANEGFYRAFESLDIRRMDEVWARDESVLCVHPGWDVLSGWRAVRDSWVRIFNNTRSMKFSITNRRVSATGEVGWVLCTEEIEQAVEEGAQRVAVLATNVFERREGRWLMVHHHGSALFRPEA